MYKIGAVIMAGGKNSRMNGKNKAQLSFNGNSFMEILIAQLVDFNEILISVDKKERFPQIEFTPVEDIYLNCGPIGGLHAALTKCQSDYLLAVSCDMPLFQKGFADYLSSYTNTGADCIVTVSRDGRYHPLCALYRKDSYLTMEKQIVAGNYKMKDLLKQMKVITVSLEDTNFLDDIVKNINTPEDYDKLCSVYEKSTDIAERKYK